MAARLGDEFDFCIVTLDRDSGESCRYEGIDNDVWVPVDKARVTYCDPSALSVRKLAKLVAEVSPNIVYLNSFFDSTFTQRMLLARWLGAIEDIPVVLAPRGEFSEGALKLKRIKKMTYIRLCEKLGLYRNLRWQASSALESADIRRNLSFVANSDVHEAMDLAPLPEQGLMPTLGRQAGEPLRVCFLSRITPMKNLDFALRVLGMVKTEVTFTIYGPIAAPDYWADCERIIAALPRHVSVIYAGEIRPENVGSTLGTHDLFVLPTRGENYGHVIHEALGAGLPVLLSDQTPWQQVTERGVGWTLPLEEPANFARTIDDVYAWDRYKAQSTARRAIALAHEKSNDSAVLKANRLLFAAPFQT